MGDVLQFPEYDVAPMIPRTAMPQVDEIYIPDMLVWLGERSVTFDAGLINPQMVHVHQDINVEKALGMPKDMLWRPVLISSDWAVVDGDHRWYRHLHDGNQMPYIKLGMPFCELIKLLETYPRCYEVKA